MRSFFFHAEIYFLLALEILIQNLYNTMCMVFRCYTKMYNKSPVCQTEDFVIHLKVYLHRASALTLVLTIGTNALISVASFRSTSNNSVNINISVDADRYVVRTGLLAHGQLI